ncbi:carbohydrate ABC transporter permease [Paenibacillus koleovorans]|uniref:carbohydrate ABC transporter permease n=1 Tax=Paenibacillus koleovorans TaxID=121608 RepID=UPI001FEA5F8B|nr:carbohydrate ABC transporter permease [Paenibacillus koleovorans]
MNSKAVIAIITAFKQRSFTDILMTWAGNAFLMICTVVWIFPFYWGIVCSFKTEKAMFASPPQFFSFHLIFDNYIELYQRTMLVRWFFNSFYISLSTTLLVVVFSSMAGYAFSKLRFPGRDAIFFFMIAMMMLPKYVLLVPLFRLMNNLGWYNTYAGLIIPEVAVPFGIFLMRQFMQSIPKEMLEAARMDGCNEFSIFVRIVVPLVSAPIASLAIFEFVKSWNDYVWQLIMTKSESMKTLPLGVSGLQLEAMPAYGNMMAGAVLSALPMIVLFIAFQKYFTRGITLGAVKG